MTKLTIELKIKLMIELMIELKIKSMGRAPLNDLD